MLETMTQYPLSAGQRSMLYHHLLYPKSYGNYEFQHFVLKGSLREDFLRRAWRAVYARHPALRTRIEWNARNQPVQIVDYAIPDITIVSGKDKRTFFDNIRLARSKRYRVELTKRIFMVIIWLHSGHADVYLHTHHIIYDGWSTSILLRDFLQAYRQMQDQTISLGNPTPHFTQMRAGQTELEGAERFFRQYLKGYRQSLPSREYEGYSFGSKGYWRQKIPVSYTQLQQAADRFQVTAAALTIAVIGSALCRFYRAEDMISGVVFSGRSPFWPCVESIVGPFLNVLPLRLPPWALWEQSRLSYIRSVGWNLIALGEHQTIPWPEILERLEEQRWLSFPAVIAFQNYPIDSQISSAMDDGLEIEYLGSRYYPLNDLCVEVKLLGEACTLELCYTKSRFDSKTIQKLAQDILERLQTTTQSEKGEAWSTTAYPQILHGTP